METTSKSAPLEKYLVTLLFMFKSITTRLMDLGMEANNLKLTWSCTCLAVFLPPYNVLFAQLIHRWAVATNISRSGGGMLDDNALARF